MLILLFFEDFWDSSPQKLRMTKPIILCLKTSVLTTFFKLLRAAGCRFCIFFAKPSHSARSFLAMTGHENFDNSNKKPPSTRTVFKLKVCKLFVNNFFEFFTS